MISIRNLSKKYGQEVIYKNTDYEFLKRGITCFLGPSGSGKTTLLNLIAAFDKDYEGEIKVNNVNLKNLSLEEGCTYRANNIGFIFQSYNLLKGYTALENVMMPMNIISGISEETKIERGKSLLKQVGLSHKENQKVESLSGGEKQRVCIARALINNPSIILADEPTGALDRENTKEIMSLLQEIGKDKAVIIITHDEEVAEYASEVISLEENKINIIKKGSREKSEEVAVTSTKENEELSLKPKKALSLAVKNLKVHMAKFIISAVIIAFSCAAFVGALGSKEIFNNAVQDFKDKNFFYNIGMIPMYNNGEKINDEMGTIFTELKSMEDIENVYFQYNIKDVKIGDIQLEEKIPTDVSKISMVYGNMPRDEKNEIVISPSLAKQLNNNIKELIGEEITLTYKDKEKKDIEIVLKISGITDVQYDDFTLSPDVERVIYENTDLENPTSISFYIKDFNNIPLVDEALKDKGVDVFTKAKEVENFQNTFGSLIKIYNIISIVILIVGFVISVVILFKVCAERHKEIGILSAMGYTKGSIKSILIRESCIFSIGVALIAVALLNILSIVYIQVFGYPLAVSAINIGIVVGMAIICTMIISNVINNKLIKTEPVKALNK